MLIARYSGHCEYWTCEPPALDLIIVKVNETIEVEGSWLKLSVKDIKGVKTKPMCSWQSKRATLIL